MKTAILLIVLFGCARSSRDPSQADRIRCYSGGQVIYDAVAADGVSRFSSSFWELTDSKTGRFVRVSGDCVVEN